MAPSYLASMRSNRGVNARPYKRPRGPACIAPGGRLPLRPPGDGGRPDPLSSSSPSLQPGDPSRLLPGPSLPLDRLENLDWPRCSGQAGPVADVVEVEVQRLNRLSDGFMSVVHRLGYRDPGLEAAPTSFAS